MDFEDDLAGCEGVADLHAGPDSDRSVDALALCLPAAPECHHCFPDLPRVDSPDKARFAPPCEGGLHGRHAPFLSGKGIDAGSLSAEPSSRLFGSLA